MQSKLQAASMHSHWIRTILLSWICAGATITQVRAAERYSDPHTPAEQKHPSSGKRLQRVGLLQKQEARLAQELAAFPPIESRSTPPHRRFGYLSGRYPVSATNRFMKAWVQLKFPDNWTLKVEGIALIPAYYPEFSAEKNYGFPKRFKIEGFLKNTPDVPVLLVDWTEEDFPDPGLHPVFFSLPDLPLQNVRLTVTRGVQEDDSQFFALDELMVFRAGSDIAPPAYQNLTASSSFEAPPYWQLLYLTDRRIQAGNFLHLDQPSPDFIQYFGPDSFPENAPQVEIDLGENHNIGRVELYPAKIQGMPTPEFAFPRHYRVDLLKKLDPEIIAQTLLINPEEEGPTSGMRWHPLYSGKGRYLRLTMLDLPRHKGRPVMALGEIRAIGDRGNEQINYAAEKKIRTRNFPTIGTADTALLVDGVSNGKKIIPERIYIEQLAARKIIAHELARTRQQLMIARATRASLFWTIGISGGILLFFSMLFWVVHLRNARQREVHLIRQQIAADLHDDISSNLGTISMITKRLQEDSSPSLIREKLQEIGHIAQESFISVKEIIWHMDSDIVHLCEMFDKIEKTARSILTDCQVDCTFPSPQGIPVPAKTRRNIMLLVKEALYNSAKYAEARHMHIRADVENATLELSMKDDGVGFDPSSDANANSDSGRGLSNMKRRARLLGAELDIHSEPEKGTEVLLKMPLN